MNFTIKRDEWRCGSISSKPENRHGKGKTYLCNKENFLCCLGQISEQLGAERCDIMGLSIPRQTCGNVEGILVNNSMPSQLSQEAMSINDCETTTREEKELLLTELFEQYGHTIEFVGEYND